MQDDFAQTTIGATGIKVHRLGLSATNRPGKKTVYRAFDAGINYFFAYGFDTQMLSVLKDLFRSRRDELVIASGAYNLLIAHTNLRRSLEKRLRQLGTNYLDVFLFLGVMKEKQLPDDVLEEMRRFKEEGKVRAIGISTHERKLAGRLAEQGALDVFMVRYNAAHRGAEQDIFPYLEEHNSGVVSYTATRWGYLVRRPKGYPQDGRVPTAAECYRFVLSNPKVHVCMTAPSNEKHLEANLKSIQEGPLSDEDIAFMKEFGDVVHNTKKWFM